ncbi:neo-calmodulin-like [Nematostella vectensis]|uniref:neo-calmodulin-like n=1 Tax=Nematostella vectensis TaxID=45351 RepID=UPI0020777A9A|nr:neo-calmodulin-like [Nematostella vectensis]XP_048579866.1 neo-calmodulin-like [Nematostella vectensis]
MDTTSSWREEIEDAFLCFDSSGKGSIKMVDCLLLIRSLGYNLSEAKMLNYTRLMGYAANTKATLPEINELISLIDKEQCESFRVEMQSAYSLFDSDNKGYICLEEFKRAFGYTCATDEEIAEIMRLGDKDGDGKLEFQDFRRLMLPVDSIEQMTASAS